MKSTRVIRLCVISTFMIVCGHACSMNNEMPSKKQLATAEYRGLKLSLEQLAWEEDQLAVRYSLENVGPSRWALCPAVVHCVFFNSAGEEILSSPSWFFIGILPRADCSYFERTYVFPVPTNACSLVLRLGATELVTTPVSVPPNEQPRWSPAFLARWNNAGKTD
jgi:hypothetical protein